jgi:hypothetical protein
VHGHRPKRLWRPQAAQRAGSFTVSLFFATPAWTIAQAQPPTAAQAVKSIADPSMSRIVPATV